MTNTHPYISFRNALIPYIFQLRYSNDIFISLQHVHIQHRREASIQTADQTSLTKRNMKLYFFGDSLSAGPGQILKENIRSISLAISYQKISANRHSLVGRHKARIRHLFGDSLPADFWQKLWRLKIKLKWKVSQKICRIDQLFVYVKGPPSNFFYYFVNGTSCLIWQKIRFILPPNEYGCVYAWTTLR